MKLGISWSLLLLIIGCSPASKPPSQADTLPFYDTPDFTPLWYPPGSDSARACHRIDTFSFTNQRGLLFTRSHVEGRIYVANFFFTSCGSICPKMTANLKLVQQRFRDNPHLVFLLHTVTPWIDTPHRLQWYANKMGLTGAQWQLLTGSQGALYKLARQSYFAEEETGFTKDSSEFLHTEHLLLIDGNQHIRGVYNGTLQLEAQRLADDIAILLNEQ